MTSHVKQIFQSIHLYCNNMSELELVANYLDLVLRGNTLNWTMYCIALRT